MVKFISVNELKERLSGGQQSYVLADCRFLLNDPAAGEAVYAAGHIPGAVYVHLERDLSGPKRPDGAGGRHPLPDPSKLAVRLGSLGIGNGTTVIAYDDQGGAYAARLMWLLQWLGHDGERLIAAGGFAAWQASGGESSAAVPSPAAVQFTPHVQEGLAVDAAYVRERIGRSDVTIIDSREAPRYRGEIEPIDPKAGHVPSAINRFWKEGFDEDGMLKPARSQLERFAGLAADDEIIVYCGSGVTATPNFFALQSAGFTNVKLYAGSWSDWISYEGNAVATGEEE
ncbi:sulfurtransferase [Paenibacillus protaetiae]|uniref:thiosulfate sulfurtransferase n=1 Tax=Paenibacillus protaetiae TaxID=2509456 RepID=A0A4P6EUU8_9BACL|nr:sulfurtransferase [Paenibacillus protaetiae]QAY65913.1 sulfurtransferase [Paenibacillus protaetiae]